MQRYRLRRAAMTSIVALGLAFAPVQESSPTARAAELQQDQQYARPPQLVIHGEVIHTELPLFMRGDIVYAPARTLLTRLGYQLEWDAAEQALTASTATLTLRHKPGSDIVLLNQRVVQLEQSSTLLEDTLWVPVQPMVQALGDQLSWSSITKTLYVKPGLASYVSRTLRLGYTRLSYEGKSKEGLRHGQGRLYLDGELWYEGSFAENKLDGTGQLYENGRLIYSGSFIQNEPTGKGAYHYSGGGQYEGDFVNGQQTGTGSRYDTAGKLVYSGEWVNGVTEGNGRIFVDGVLSYSGQIKQGLPSGTGVGYDRTGTKVYEGSWSHGKRHGEGQLFDAGQIQYAGSFMNDKRHGKGTRFRKGQMPWHIIENGVHVRTEMKDTVELTSVVYKDDKLSAEHEGFAYLGPTLSSGLPHGKGELLARKKQSSGPAGAITNYDAYYEGDFAHGKLTGYGRLYDSNGLLQYEGEVQDGKRQGRGKAFDKGLLVFEGQWSNDREEAAGRRFVYDKEFPGTAFTGRTSVLIYEGTYRNGKLSEELAIYKYYGAYDDGMPNGTGTVMQLYDAKSDTKPLPPIPDKIDGAVVYEGSFKNGLKEGPGKLYENKLLVYDGPFVKGLREGIGKAYKDNTVYEGPFHEDKREGAGKIYDSFGTLLYDGEFKNDMKNGYGKIYDRFGKLSFEGEFKDDKKHGFGKAYLSDGETIWYQGEYREDKTLSQYLQEQSSS